MTAYSHSNDSSLPINTGITLITLKTSLTSSLYHTNIKYPRENDYDSCDEIRLERVTVREKLLV